MKNCVGFLRENPSRFIKVKYYVDIIRCDILLLLTVQILVHDIRDEEILTAEKSRKQLITNLSLNHNRSELESKNLMNTQTLPRTRIDILSWQKACQLDSENVKYCTVTSRQVLYTCVSLTHRLTPLLVRVTHTTQSIVRRHAPRQRVAWLGPASNTG